MVALRALVVLAFLLLAFLFAPVLSAQEAEGTPDDVLASDIAEKERELRELTGKIQVLRRARLEKEREEERITTTIEILESRIQEARLQMDLVTVTIEDVRLRLKQNAEEIAALGKREERLRGELLGILRTIDSYEHRSLWEAILTQGTFSDFLRTQEAYESIQRRVTAVLTATQDARRARGQRETELAARQEELLNLQKLQEAQKASLLGEEERKRTLLSRNIAQQARVASLLSEAEEARREIQQDIFTLRNVGIRLSLKEAEDFARYAGGLTGVRPALLLGVLKVESNIGSNVGSGRYPDDVHPAHRDAFLRVAEKLGLDPKTTPVSAKPTTYAGWGGAMGPGQIMPGTWERVEPAVARLTGNALPSPFDLRDAFVATAVILQGAGAASGNEFEAVSRYFAGPNWQRFTWYGDRVLAVAKEYEARGP